MRCPPSDADRFDCASINSDGDPHPLCPVNALRMFLRVSKSVSTSSLFFNPRTLNSCTKARISQLIRRIVKLSQPNIYCRAHDLRKFATIQAFLSNMSCSNIRKAGFWHSNSTFARRYLPLMWV